MVLFFCKCIIRFNIIWFRPEKYSKQQQNSANVANWPNECNRWYKKETLWRRGGEQNQRAVKTMFFFPEFMKLYSVWDTRLDRMGRDPLKLFISIVCFYFIYTNNKKDTNLKPETLDYFVSMIVFLYEWMVLRRRKYQELVCVLSDEKISLPVDISYQKF